MLAAIAMADLEAQHRDVGDPTNVEAAVETGPELDVGAGDDNGVTMAPDSA